MVTRFLLLFTFIFSLNTNASLSYEKVPSYLDSIKEELSDSLLDMFEDEEENITKQSCEELNSGPWYYSIFRFGLEARYATLQSKIMYRECQHLVYLLENNQNENDKENLCSDDMNNEILELKTEYINIKNSDDRDYEELTQELFLDSKSRLNNLRMLNYIICR